VRCLLEAEHGQLDAGTRPWLGDGTAVGMYGVGLRKGMLEGSLTLRTGVPRKAEYRLLARTRREGTIAVAEGIPVATTGANTDAWQWREIGRLALEPGDRQIAIRLAGDIQVDQFLLTDEPNNTPAGPMVLDSWPPDAPSRLRAKVLDPFTVRLDWQATEGGDVAHYNVYCGRKASYAPIQARRIGSPAESVFVDWGLRPDTTYHYRVVAVDRAGNESAPAEVVATTAPTRIATVSLEAEAAERSGRVEAIDHRRAENGKAIRFPVDGDPGLLTVTFEVPLDGEYALWTHVYQLRGDADPLVAHLDDHVEFPWRVRVPGRQWGWDFVGGTGRLGKKRWSRSDGHVVADPLLLQLKRGRHTLKLSDNQGHCIDRLVVTNDPGWEKTGFDSLRGGQ
jgi:hypothetical protein